MSTAVKSSKYSYRSTGGGSADVNIEYSADLSALSRLEVSPFNNESSYIIYQAKLYNFKQKI